MSRLVRLNKSDINFKLPPMFPELKWQRLMDRDKSVKPDTVQSFIRIIVTGHTVQFICLQLRCTCSPWQFTMESYEKVKIMS